MKCKFLLLSLMAGLILYAFNARAKGNHPTSIKVATTFNFVENKGQITNHHQVPRRDIDFKLSAGNNLNIFVGSGKIEYQWAKLTGQSSRKANLLDPMAVATGEDITYEMYRMEVILIGASRQAKVIREEAQSFYERFYLPTVPDAGAIARSYRKITYQDIYPHIDWVFYFNNKGQLEHDFVVRPGGKVSDIKMRYGGATTLQLQADGSLQAQTPMGNVNEKAPYCYDEKGRVVASHFVLKDSLLSFAVDSYNGTLIIDPVLEWGTYFGGLGNEQQTGLVADSAGNLYMSGGTTSLDNIATTGSYQTTFAGPSNATVMGDAFVAKFSAAGKRLWATYYGGVLEDRGLNITIDPQSGDLYLAGSTRSTSGIATTGAHQTVQGGNLDAFLLRLDTSGQRLWCTYYGGSSAEGSSYSSMDVACDKGGNVYLFSETNSKNNIASTNAYQVTKVGGKDAFIVKFNNKGIRQWGTYFGGDDDDMGNKIVCDAQGNVLVAGYTLSTNQMATAGSHQPTLHALIDGFVSKFDTDGQQIWSSYYGGEGVDIINALAVDKEDNIYIGGATSSTQDMATATGQQPVFAGGAQDGFVAVFDPAGKRDWASYYGGPAADAVSDLVLSRDRKIYITGLTVSTTGIAIPGDFQDTINGFSDAFLMQTDSAGHKIWSTYYGGTGDETPIGIALNEVSIFLSGFTNSSSRISTQDSEQPQLGGGEHDAFLACFRDCGPMLLPDFIVGDTALCEGQTARFEISAMPNAEHYTWVLPDGWVGASDTNIIVTVAGEHSGIVKLVGGNACTTSDTLSLQVVVFLLPQPIIQQEGNVLKTTKDYITYEWIKDGVQISGATAATYIPITKAIYSVQVSDTSGCYGISDDFNMEPVNILDASVFDARVRLYPNPAHSWLSVNAPFALDVSVYSVEGRLLLRQKRVSHMDVSALPEGSYWLLAYDQYGKRVGIFKWIKQ